MSEIWFILGLEERHCSNVTCGAHVQSSLCLKRNCFLYKGITTLANQQQNILREQVSIYKCAPPHSCKWDICAGRASCTHVMWLQMHIWKCKKGLQISQGSLMMTNYELCMTRAESCPLKIKVATPPVLGKGVVCFKLRSLFGSCLPLDFQDCDCA